MASVALAMREVRRSKARFGLLSLAVGVLVFIIVFQQALLGALVQQFVGAIEKQSADVLVYSTEARRNLVASVVPPAAVDEVAAVDGVAAAGPLGVATVTVELAGGLTDATVIGAGPDGPGGPSAIAQGRRPTADGEVVASPTSDVDLSVGDRVVVVPGGTPLTVVGLVDDAQLSVTTTLFGTYATFEQVRRAANPDATAVLPTAVAVAVDQEADAADVAARITEQVDGVEALDRATAADESPGVASVNQSLQLILALTFVVVGLVVGFFFLILTVQKRASLTLLRALGGPAWRLAGSLLVQVALVAGGGIVIGTLLAGALLTVAPLGASLAVGPVATTAAVIAVFSVIASLGSIRRVLRIDPVEATRPGGVR